jgi:hypothetical protein
VVIQQGPEKDFFWCNTLQRVCERSGERSRLSVGRISEKGQMEGRMHYDKKEGLEKNEEFTRPLDIVWLRSEA